MLLCPCRPFSALAHTLHAQRHCLLSHPVRTALILAPGGARFHSFFALILCRAHFWRVSPLALTPVAFMSSLDICSDSTGSRRALNWFISLVSSSSLLTAARFRLVPFCTIPEERTFPFPSHSLRQACRSSLLLAYEGGPITYRQLASSSLLPRLACVSPPRPIRLPVSSRPSLGPAISIASPPQPTAGRTSRPSFHPAFPRSFPVSFFASYVQQAYASSSSSCSYWHSSGPLALHGILLLFSPSSPPTVALQQSLLPPHYAAQSSLNVFVLANSRRCPLACPRLSPAVLSSCYGLARPSSPTRLRRITPHLQ